MLYRITGLNLVILALFACTPVQTPAPTAPAGLKNPFDSNIISVQYFRFIFETGQPVLHAVFSESWNRNFGPPTACLIREPCRTAFRDVILFIGEAIDDEAVKRFVADIIKRGFNELPAANEASLAAEWLRKVRNNKSIYPNVRIITVQTEKIRRSIMALDLPDNPQLQRKFKDVEGLTMLFVNGNSIYVGVQIEPFKPD